MEKTWLWAFPRSVRPNHLTVARFILIPVVLVLLHYDHRWWALGVFVAAICYRLHRWGDGPHSRPDHPLGTLIDPIADKLLVGAVLAWIGYDYLVVQIILAFIVLELVLMAARHQHHIAPEPGAVGQRVWQDQDGGAEPSSAPLPAFGDPQSTPG